MSTADVSDIPTYWFALLEMARERGRFLEAQHAMEQLRRLGVEVHFVGGRPRRRREKGVPFHVA